MRRVISTESLLSVNPESFWNRVDMVGDCWLWLGARRPHGYGVCYIPGLQTTTSAHRVAYALTKGAIPEGYHVDHLCLNRGCVNPAHLEPVTTSENVRRSLGAFCKRGHPWDGRGSGCAECKADRQRARSRASAPFRILKPHYGASKTACPAGHPYDEANTYRNPAGGRMCRECMRQRNRARYWRAKALTKDSEQPFPTPPEETP